MGSLPTRRRGWIEAFVLFAAASSSICLGAAPPAPPIRVGPNVRISAANPERLHHEIGMAASPSDPRRLLVCSMISPAKRA